jgi:hypothetical protein
MKRTIRMVNVNNPGSTNYNSLPDDVVDLMVNALNSRTDSHDSRGLHLMNKSDNVACIF